MKCQKCGEETGGSKVAVRATDEATAEIAEFVWKEVPTCPTCALAGLSHLVSGAQLAADDVKPERQTP